MHYTKRKSIMNKKKEFKNVFIASVQNRFQ